MDNGIEEEGMSIKQKLRFGVVISLFFGVIAATGFLFAMNWVFGLIAFLFLVGIFVLGYEPEDDEEE